MKKSFMISMMIIMLCLLAGCTAGPNEIAGVVNKEGQIAGFWKGLWHGFIFLFTFVISLFNDQVSVYEIHNNGNGYHFGYLIGIMFFFGGSSNKAGRMSGCSKKDNQN